MKRFPIYLSLPDDAREAIGADIGRWFGFVGPRIERGYLLGEGFSVANAYLFVIACGALQMGFPLGKEYSEYVARIEARPAVLAALSREIAQSHKAS